MTEKSLTSVLGVGDESRTTNEQCLKEESKPYYGS